MPDKDAKLDMVKNKVLEKMKGTLRRERRLSTSESVCSLSSISSSRTRQRSEGEESESEQTAKQIRTLKDRKTVIPQSRLPGPVSFQS